MISYLEIVDPPAAAQSLALGCENDVNQLDFRHTNYIAISPGYYLTMQALLSRFPKTGRGEKALSTVRQKSG
jgi:hypothetical protein